MDTIIGGDHKGAIVSVVEMTSKLIKLIQISHKTAKKVEEALLEKLRSIKDFVHTLTSDNGKEFANHQKVSFELEAEFYFAKPYHSWERGLNEHTNGLVHQYLPKGRDLDDLSKAYVEKIELLLNNRPRKVLEYETPLEFFNRPTTESLNVALAG